ncbi:MAG: type II toxin-antitoxin system prevent-host-death family antitoxin [Spirochaetales bacterium]|nr:type II toxin-antitoxin system prevent-host-death family antitoxin [Spirochaetales bacterium]
MKIVPLKELKANLAMYAEEAAAGETIEITRYNRPYVRLITASSDGLRRGSRLGMAELKSAGKAASQGAYLEVLLKDRE